MARETRIEWFERVATAALRAIETAGPDNKERLSRELKGWRLRSVTYLKREGVDAAELRAAWARAESAVKN
jgi:hypothetical protein